jgi:hypothetical protein
MKQGLILHHIATGIIQEVPLNGKEMQLAMDNGPTINDSWDLMVASVASRSDITINDGNWDLEKIVVDGVSRVAH